VREPRIVLTREAFAALADHLAAALVTYLAENPLRSGMGKEELKGRLPKRSDARFFGILLAALARDGRVLVDHDLVKPVGGKPASAPGREGVWDAIEAALLAGTTEPPTVKELGERLKMPEKTLLEHLAVLVREGRAIRVANDLFYAPQPLATMGEQLVACLNEEAEITPTRFRELTGLSRKFMIPVLEYFDSIKVTIRVGDKRVLRKR